MNTDLNLDNGFEKKSKKNEETFPEHVPVVSFDVQKERDKEEARKLTKKLKKSGKTEPIVVTKENGVKKASKLTTTEQEDEIVRCASNPIYFIETFLTIFDQTQGTSGLIVPFKLFNFQKNLIKSYQDNRFVIANKYRQAGISTTTCAYIAWYVMFNNNRQVAIVADKLITARDELMGDVVDFIESCPAWLRPKTGKESEKGLKDTQQLKVYDNECKLGAFASKSLRSMTPTLLFWDETAWAEKGDKFWTSAQPTLQTGGRAIMVSCVTKDTYLYTDKGIKQIKDFIPNDELGAHVINDYNVLGKDKVRKGNLFFNNGFVDTLKIKTTFSELDSSYNHKYWAYSVKNEKYGIFKASELEVDDYVSLQYGMNIWGDNDDCSDFKPTLTRNTKNIYNPTKITIDMAYFIGLYISEGYMRNVIRNGKLRTTQITITCGDSLRHIFDKIGFKYNFDGIHYTINSKNIGEFFEYLGFDLSKKAKQKIIPSRLLEMGRENIIAMIQGIVDGDGWATNKINKNHVSIGIQLSSKELINQLRILFSNFGILTDYTESIIPPTKLVKVSSKGYRITATNSFAIKYFQEIGFRFDRKQIKENNFNTQLQKHSGVTDNIPNGKELMRKIYAEIKYYGKLHELQSNGIKIESWINRIKQDSLSSSRKTLLNIIELEKNNISDELLNELKPIISNNLYWTKIKSIEKSKNWTYDFSLPNDNPEDNDFHHSVIYNQILGFQTPSGLDAVFYKTFMGAREIDDETGLSKNNFHAVELWWFNDPRYNIDLVWLKNKGKKDEKRWVDENWSNQRRIELQDEGWEASSPWFEDQIKNANGDMRKIAQELLCSFLGSGDNFIAEQYLKRIEENEIGTILRQAYVDNNMWIFEESQPGEDYIMALDASAGHGEDYSTLNMLKIKEIIEEKIIKKNGKEKKVKIKRHKVEQVAEYYGKVTPQMLTQIAYQFGKEYNDAYAVVDVTGGYGVMTVEGLLEIGYENVHYAEVTHKPTRDRLQGYIKKGQKIMPDGAVMVVDLIPGFFIGNNRASVLLEMQRAIHLEDIIIKSTRLLNELKTFVTIAGNRVADHKRTFHDDSIMGLAIGLYVLNFELAKFKQSKGISEKMVKAIITNNDIGDIGERNVNRRKPMISPDSTNPLNPYAANEWLFQGLKKK